MSETPEPTYDPALGTMEINVIECKGIRPSAPTPQKERDLLVKVYIADFSQPQRKFLTKPVSSKPAKWGESLAWNFSHSTPIYEASGLLVFEVIRAGSLLGSSTPYGSVAYKVTDLVVSPSNFVENWLTLQDTQGVPVGQIHVSVKYTADLADTLAELRKEPAGTYKFKTFQSSVRQAMITGVFDSSSSEKCRTSVQRCNEAVAKWLKSVAPVVQVININSHIEPMSMDISTTVWYRIIGSAIPASTEPMFTAAASSSSDPNAAEEETKKDTARLQSTAMDTSYENPYPGSGAPADGAQPVSSATEAFVISDGDPFQ